ncbi:MAG: Sua5/YciO/YrdC/YwlC family protein [Gammaproteobacteria bacterium]|nr:Sua5/YciO/YrdC/YwlC family protein [Gammaproteobacteria bacterium]
MVTKNYKVYQAQRVIKEGGIVAYPTEGVFGLGCDPLNPSAVYRLLRIKKRDLRKGLILIAHHSLAFKPFLAEDCVKIWQERYARSKGEPCTWVFPARLRTPQWLTGEHKSIAIRVTTHPLARALCEAVGFPIVSTSANTSCGTPAKDALTVRLHFGRKIDFILSGVTGPLKKPTPIRDGLTGKIIRA